jgi:hypothetical protein
MSFEEKSTWATAVLFVAVPAAYLAFVLPQLATTPVADLEWQVPMLVSIGVSILLAIGAVVIVALTNTREAGKADQRDKDVARFGEYVGGNALGALMLVPLLLAMAEVDWFWIATSIYVGLAVAAFVGAAAKIIVYRRGF